jgi:hypothetical protein
LRRSGEGEKDRCLPWSKEEEGAYIFWMKQVAVGRLTKWPLYTGDLYMKGFDYSMKYSTLVVNKHF